MNNLSQLCFCCTCASSCLKIWLPVVVVMSILSFQKIYFKKEKGVPFAVVFTKQISSTFVCWCCCKRVRIFDNTWINKAQKIKQVSRYNSITSCSAVKLFCRLVNIISSKYSLLPVTTCNNLMVCAGASVLCHISICINGIAIDSTTVASK